MEPLPPGLPAALARAEAHPGDPSAAAGVTWIQTHISHVYLTGARAWKLRKAVDLGFVDFSTRAARNADCAREVVLNRRLAPDVYLGVAPIEAAGAGYTVGAVRRDPPADLAADPREHVVAMRRLPDACDALSLLERGRLRAAHVEAVALRLAAFHDAHGLGVPSPFSPAAWRAGIEQPMRECLETLAAAAGRVVPEASVERLRLRADAVLAERADAFEARRRAGRAVDGHGDVHLAHVWFEPGRAEPLLVDCIEFRDDLRRIDAAADAAFLAMDLAYRRRPALAARFLRVYAAARDDFDLFRVVDWFVAYRAAVRAKVAVLAADDRDIAPAQREAAGGSARRHLAQALRSLAPPGPGALVLMAGTVGTGKSTAAGVAADALRGVVVASDRVRKHRAGLAPHARDGAARGLYTEAETEAVYAGLLERAAPIVESGRVAVLDATFARARHREAALRWARARGLPTVIVETRCAAETARARLARRARRGDDPSDAGPELLAWSRARFEPVVVAPPAVHHVVHTDQAGWRAALRRALREIPAAATPEEKDEPPCPIARSAT